VFEFQLQSESATSQARTGRLLTPHGPVETPVFMPVGTAATVKGVTPDQLTATGATMILCNTYHLALRPGAEVIEKLGGLHKVCGWDGPILTDSGGYQVFSLAELNAIDDGGVTFKSHVDGAILTLTPERAVAIQNQLGADIIMCFDQCPPLPGDPRQIREATDRTIRWAKRCKAAHHRDDQALFGIVQGGLDAGIRKDCIEALAEIGFPGYALGGLSVGESHDDMVQCLDAVAHLLPADRPRYLMGVGMPRDIVAAVNAGVDMFDCVLPSRNGRNAFAFTPTGKLKLRNSVHRESTEPLDATCECYTCRGFCRGYLRHLFLAGEMLGPTLTSIHNLFFYQRLMRRIRELILADDLARIHDEFPVTRSEANASEDEFDMDVQDS